MTIIKGIEIKGKWITFNEDNKIRNHFFEDGFYSKKSIAICGHDAYNTHHTNMWGYVRDCPECTERLNQIVEEIQPTKPRFPL